MGVKIMSYKIQKMISFILAFVILFMGLFYVNPKHTSSPYPSFLKQCFLSDNSAKQLISYINSSNGTISPSEICAVEKLGIRNHSYIQKFTNRHIMNRRDMRVSLLLLCIDIFTAFFFHLFMIERTVKLVKSYLQEAILTYIHNIDGKKRSYNPFFLLFRVAYV